MIELIIWFSPVFALIMLPFFTKGEIYQVKIAFFVIITLFTPILGLPVWYWIKRRYL